MLANPHLLLAAVTLLSVNLLAASEPPNPLAGPDGTLATSPETWRETVRPATLRLFRQHVYGARPVGKPDDFKAVVASEDAKALDGMATRKEIEISYSGPGGKGRFPAVLFTPNAAKGPVPAFLLIDFIAADPELPGNLKGLWPVRAIIARGYARKR